MPAINPEWIVAGCAVITLAILWTATAIGAVVWLNKRFTDLKTEILADFKLKHDENAEKVEAMRELVMRHDIILDPEFNGSGHMRRSKQ